MKIDILCTDGSPIGVCPECLWGDEYHVGVGGSEYALLTMCELWAKQGHELRLYNTPHKYINILFEQFPTNAFKPDDDRDVLIVFRSPNAKAIMANGMKVWWSCDQYTIGDFREFAPYMNKIVCISPYHSAYFAEFYGIRNTIPIDLAIRLDDFGKHTPIKNRLIFTSVPNRGLHHLRRIYRQLVTQIPDISLAITSDYRLWGTAPLNEAHRAGWALEPSVSFLGAVPRKKYIEELLKADMIVYPCEYDELFCISIAEAECCGVYPVTTYIGALQTTTMGDFIKASPLDERTDDIFVQRVVELTADRNLFENKQKSVALLAKERFSPSCILKQWDEKVFK